MLNPCIIPHMANQAKIGNTVFHVGDTVKVYYKLIEKEKVAGKAKREVKEEVRERIQIFEGIVISIRGEGVNRSFTVRRIGVSAIGIERIFPLISPWIKKITVSKKGNVRRSKLYYLREKVGRAAEKLKKEIKEEANAEPDKNKEKEAPDKNGKQVQGRKKLEKSHEPPQK